MMPVPQASQVKIAALLKTVIDKSEDDKLKARALPVYLGAQGGIVTAAKDAKAAETARKDLETYAGKFVEQIKKDIKGPASVQQLGLLLGLPLAPGKDGAQAQATALFKKLIDEGDNKAQRLQALTAFLGAQEKVVMTSKDAAAVKAARNELDSYRKVIQKDFKGQVKDLFIGATMPELKSKDLADKDVKLSDLKGKVVVLDIWATWCPPCRAMIPHEREMVKKFKGKPFALISVSADAKKETVTSFLEKNEMPWTHWWDGQRGSIGTELNVRYYPTIYVLDTKGVIRFKDVRDKAMEKAVETLLKEVEDKTKGS